MLHITQRDYSYDTSGISVCGVTYVYNRREKQRTGYKIVIETVTAKRT